MQSNTEGTLKTPYQDLLPPLSTEEFEALKADIEANGLREPILVDEDGNILDGHHRYRIKPDAPVRVIKGLSEAERQAFVIRANLARRNLSPEQKREVQRKQRGLFYKLRDSGMTVKIASATVGVPEGTGYRWEAERKPSKQVATSWGTKPSDQNTTILQPKVSCTHLDCRVKIPPKLHPVILERVERGEPQAQVAADLKVSQQAISKIVAKERKRKVEAAAAPRDDRDSKTPKLLGSYDEVEIRRGDFREVLADIPDQSVDLVLTDPPYGKQYLDLWDALGQWAAKKLKPSGLLVSYAGQLYLPEMINRLSKHLKWWWLCAVVHGGPGKLTPLDYPVRKVINKWKPILVFMPPEGTGLENTFEDLFAGTGPSKHLHNWEQPFEEAEDLIKTFCPEGGFVVDPFAGSGAFGKAAVAAKRRFLGAEILQA